MSGRPELPEPARPVLRIVRGTPTDAELAALVAVLAARTAAPPTDPPARSAWADPAGRLRVTGRPGRDAWRRSALPS